MKTLLRVAALLLVAASARAQTSPSCAQLPSLACLSGSQTVTATWTFNGILNATGGTIRVPNSTSAPGTCTVGDLYFDNDAAAGSRLKLCTATNTFTNVDEDGASGSHNLLSATHGDTVAAAAARGAVIVGNSTPAWARVTVGAANTFLHSDGTDTTFAAISSSDIGAGDLASVLTWSESKTSCSPDCTLANAPRAGGATATALLVSNGIVMKPVASCGGVNEFTLSGSTVTPCDPTNNANFLAYYEK